MRLYTLITQDGALSSDVKAELAMELTTLHSEYAGVPKNWVHVVFQDCGTAGDRGLLHPELVHSATRDTLVQIQSSGDDTCFVSANRTCELGMRQTTGKVYESFIYALEEATRLSGRPTDRGQANGLKRSAARSLP